MQLKIQSSKSKIRRSKRKRLQGTMAGRKSPLKEGENRETAPVLGRLVSVCHTGGLDNVLQNLCLIRNKSRNYTFIISVLCCFCFFLLS